MFQVPAQAYDRWIGRYSPQLAAALIEFAGIEPGTKALDVGCGPGALSAALVGRLGAANVYAVDPSEPFVEACRERLPGVNAIVASAESLPFPDGEFDVALAQLVVNFMSDPEAGVREMARVDSRGWCRRRVRLGLRRRNDAAACVLGCGARSRPRPRRSRRRIESDEVVGRGRPREALAPGRAHGRPLRRGCTSTRRTRASTICGRRWRAVWRRRVRSTSRSTTRAAQRCTKPSVVASASATSRSS